MLTLDFIKSKATPIAEKYGVKRLLLFGSYAEGTATENSDADFMAEMSPTLPGQWSALLRVCGMQAELSDVLGKEVDVVTLPVSKPDRLVVGKTEVIV
ncbi:hypothetical protein FACS1894202_13910 [Clostridia bacterium]|nr:hypothetical protein FACS1894202_13910 [Clostridia bacterium]